MTQFFKPLYNSIIAEPLQTELLVHPESGMDPSIISAVEDLQEYLRTQNDWIHNFGLSGGNAIPVIGKMFGVLIVETAEKQRGYIAAFSGKLAGENHHSRFVPPVFDSLATGSFVNAGMQHLATINNEIEKLEGNTANNNSELIEFLKAERRDRSVLLQNEIFDQYNFLNCSGIEKSLREIFHEAGYKNPPSGAGECAAPKLLQYAFQNNLKPLALAEFWWGLSPKSENWKHGVFYPSCKEKCKPILDFMLL